MAVERTNIAEHIRRGDRQVNGELRCDVPVGKSANTISAEESAHAYL